MRRFDTVLFDLDGTLTDNGEGITNSVAYALRRFGIEPPPREELNKFVGPPLRDRFVELYVGEENGDLAVKYYREYYRPHGIFENVVYDGIPELLAALKEAGCTLAMATSKPKIFAKKIADHFDLTQYFTIIAGSNLEGTRIKKADVIRYCLHRLGDPDPSTVLMVGDREHDILGAKAVGLPAVGVTYGYGSREELETAGAIAIADTPSDILKQILDRQRAPDHRSGALF